MWSSLHNKSSSIINSVINIVNVHVVIRSNQLVELIRTLFYDFIRSPVKRSNDAELAPHETPFNRLFSIWW